MFSKYKCLKSRQWAELVILQSLKTQLPTDLYYFLIHFFNKKSLSFIAYKKLKN